MGATARFIDWNPVAITMRSAGNSEPSVSSTERSLTRRISTPLLTPMCALRDEIRGADVDVVARAGAERLHHEAGFVLAEVDLKAGLSRGDR